MGRLSNPNLTMPPHEKLGVSKPIKGLIRLATNKEKFALATRLLCQTIIVVNNIVNKKKNKQRILYNILRHYTAAIQ